MATIVESLPDLTHLDISGTNLAGNGVAQFEAKEKIRSSDIPGLVSRANNPLEFLGLYYTAHSACRRHDIPAYHVILIKNLISIIIHSNLTKQKFYSQISGDANEEQILTSASVYRDRPIMLTKVIQYICFILFLCNK